MFNFLFVLGVVCISSDHVAPYPWRIVNGFPAKLGQFPFIAFVPGCTASILNEDTILTAGHCLCDRHTSYAVAGTISNNMWQWVFSKQTLTVSKIIVHPSYVKRCGFVDPMDFAIVKLEDKIQFNDYVQPISLHCDNPKEGRKIVSLGYGLDENNKSGTLRYAYNAMTYSCGGGYLCSPKTPNHINSGDSGGPVAVIGDNSKLMLTAVISGLTVGKEGYSYYADLPTACDWIRSQM